MTSLPPPGSALRVTEPQALRALAHPLRGKLLALLRLEGPSTASLLGRRIEQSSGSTSYHLRELARYGFVEEVERGTGRERWWQAAHRSSGWDTQDFTGEDAEVADELQHRLVELRGRLLRAWLAQRRDPAPGWAGAATFNDLPMHLTREQTERLTAELVDVLVRWRDEEQLPAGTPGTQVVQVLADVFPLTDYPL